MVLLFPLETHTHTHTHTEEVFRFCFCNTYIRISPSGSLGSVSILGSSGCGSIPTLYCDRLIYLQKFSIFYSPKLSVFNFLYFDVVFPNWLCVEMVF